MKMSEFMDFIKNNLLKMSLFAFHSFLLLNYGLWIGKTNCFPVTVCHNESVSGVGFLVSRIQIRFQKFWSKQTHRNLKVVQFWSNQKGPKYFLAITVSPALVSVRIPRSLRLVPGFRNPGSVIILEHMIHYGNPYLSCIITYPVKYGMKLLILSQTLIVAPLNVVNG